MSTNTIRSLIDPNGQDLLKRPIDSIRYLFLKLHQEILNLDSNIEMRINAGLLVYKSHKGGTNFIEAYLGKEHIELRLRKYDEVNYDDPQNLIRKAPKSHGWAMDSIVHVKSERELPYVMKLVRQSLHNVR